MRGTPIAVLTLIAVSLSVAGCNATEPPTDTEFTVKFETSKGDILIRVHPEWAPIGAAHFKKLVENGYYDGNRFFRVVPNFVVQFGLNGDPVITGRYSFPTLKDDPVLTTNARGTLVYATMGANTRTTQLFINLKDNSRLDADGFSPFAEVTKGMEVVDAITAEYGQDPKQDLITKEGNDYLESYFPRLDYILKATIVP